MIISVGLELNNDDRAIAWALDYPGCFAYGPDGPAAVIRMARELVTYENWIERHAGPGWLELGDFDIRIVDTWECYTIDAHYDPAREGYMVESFFLHDWKPLASGEVERALALLEWSRADFLQAVTGLSAEQLDRQRPGERWNIRGIIGHVARAEWWYLDRMGLAGNGPLPEDVFQQLERARGRLREVLPALAGQELVTGREGEFWSPRKLLRRSIWHEIDHREHILKLLGQDAS